MIEGDHVYAKVIANNMHGQSAYSTKGNGASIWLVPDAPLSLTNNAALTDATQIAFTWTPGVSNRGTEVIDYRVYFTLESDDSFVELDSGILDGYYTTIETLLPGENYKFKVQARNAVGFGAFSDEVTIRAARIPDSPSTVVTVIDVDSVVISWTPEYDGGSAITSYTVMIQESDSESYSEELVNCDGKDAAIVAVASCTVTIDSLKAEPYGLDWGSSIYAKVSATNIVGTSDFSVPGNGA